MKPTGTASCLRVCTVAVFLSSVFCPFSARAAETGLAPLFERAAVEVNVPLPLLLAIARVESHSHPYTINLEGKPIFFTSQAEAIAAARQALAAGKSFDSGIMQVNSQWLNRFSIPLDAFFDPEANIWLGAWILGQNIRQYPNWRADWRAIARYHSPDMTKGNRYVSQVKAVLAKTSSAALAGRGTGSNQNYFIRRIAKTASGTSSRQSVKPFDELSVAATGFVRRYNR
jgi:soluble lytic murein transglycosylase-like protein